MDYTDNFFDDGGALLFLLLLCMSAVSSFAISENTGCLERRVSTELSSKEHSGSSLELCLSVIEHWGGKNCSWVTWWFRTLCCNYSNNLECKSAAENLSFNCRRYLRRQRLFQNTDAESCSCCSTGKLKGYIKSIIRIQRKFHVKVRKDLPGCLPGMCPV